MASAQGTNTSVTLTANNVNVPGVLCAEGFKTREVGILFNLTPTLSADGQWIQITLIPEVSLPSRAGTVKYEGITPSGKTEVAQPDFYSWNLTTQLALKSGSSVLLAVMDPVAEGQYTAQDKVLLIVLTATAHLLR
jgi:Flp pilus assembly secretin CpaC